MVKCSSEREQERWRWKRWEKDGPGQSNPRRRKEEQDSQSGKSDAQKCTMLGPQEVAILEMLVSLSYDEVLCPCSLAWPRSTKG